MNVSDLVSLSLLKTSQHLGCINEGDRMANIYLVCLRTWKWTKKLFFHLFDQTVLNSYIILLSCGSRTYHQKYCLTSFWHMLEMITGEPLPQSNPRGRPNPQTSQMTCLEAWYTKYWSIAVSCFWCHVCSVKNKRMTTKFLSWECMFSYFSIQRWTSKSAI
jgi:hypothetical protein